MNNGKTRCTILNGYIGINVMITEGSVVEYRCDHGYKLKGKVSQVYTSVTGVVCVELTSGVRLGIHKCRLLNKREE